MIELNSTNRLKPLVFRFLEEKGEEYCRLYRYAPERITGDFRAWCALAGVTTQYSNEVLYGYIQARLRYVFELEADYKLTKQQLNLTDEHIAKFFGYNSRLAYFGSNKKNQHITAFLNIARAIMS